MWSSEQLKNNSTLNKLIIERAGAILFNAEEGKETYQNN